MNIPRTFSRTIAGCVASAVVAAAWLNPVQAQQETVEPPDEMAEALTSGPLHEAFAQTVTYNAEPGITVNRQPPEPIEELPPETRPDGDNVAWIPGYWGWDDERGDFIWISGVWRNLPPGREWVPGYWTESGDAWQWVSGYWADAGVQEVTYLPDPPASLETGPNIDPPDDSWLWQPGNWVWSGGRYLWRPGTWIEGRDNWVWTPAGYNRTPRGVVYVDGYWDYPVERRGIVFGSVYYRDRSWCYRPGYFHTPTVVISVSRLHSSLFCRPRYRHYYCGDYYEPSWRSAGYYPWHSFHVSHRGYDPIYAHSRYLHRRDPGWHSRLRADFDYLVKHKSARPPRTWRDFRNRRDSDGHRRFAFASDLRELSGRSEYANRLRSVSRDDRNAFARRGSELAALRAERRTSERRPAASDARDGSPRQVVRRSASPIRPAGRDAALPQPGRSANPRPAAPRTASAPDRLPAPRTADRRIAPRSSATPPRTPASARPDPRPSTRERSAPAAPRPAPRAAPNPRPREAAPRQTPRATPRPAPRAAAPKVAPRATPRAAPRATPRAAPKATPRAAPKATPRPAAPRPARRATPGSTPRAATPRVVPRAAPTPAPRAAAPRTTPRATPRAAPKATPGATPRAAAPRPTPRAAPKATPRATPRAAPRAAPRATPRSAPKPAPRAAAPRSAPKATPRPAPRPKAAPSRPAARPKAAPSAPKRDSGRRSDDERAKKRR